MAPGHARNRRTSRPARPARAAHTAVPLAKLTRPRLHAAYARERLFARLDECRSYPAVWIAGPPGAGKTTLAATWLQARRLPGIWYQLDAGDAEPATFFYYLRRAAEAAGARAKAALPLLTPEYLADVPAFARRWFRELFARLPPGAVVALDNYHEVAADSALHRTLALACEEIPGSAQLLVLSWAEPPLEFAACIARERLARIEAAELKLSAEEAAGIAAGTHALTSEELRELHAQCDGWAAGFTLLRERTRRTGLVSCIDQRGSMQEVFDYFLAQVFRDTTPEGRDTLVKTALLPRFTEAMAAALSGNARAGELLDELYRRHLFVERRYGAEVTYQYHTLFRAFLLDRARRYYTPLGLAELSQRAATVLEEAGLREDALSLFIDAGDHEGAARLIEKLAPELVAAGRGVALEEWLRKLPEPERERRPWLSYWLGAGITSVRVGEARAAYERAHAGFVQSGDRTGQAMAVVGILETHFLELDDLKRIQPWLPILELLFAAAPTFPSHDVAARAYGTLVGVLFWAVPAHPLFRLCVERLEALMSEPLDVDVKVTAGSRLAEYYGLAGFIVKAERLAALLEPLVARGGVSPLARASWFLRSCARDKLVGDSATAVRKLEQALAIATEEGLPFLLGLIYGQLADVALEAEELEEVRGIFQRWRDALPREGRVGMARLRWMQAKLAAIRGELDQAILECEAACDIAAALGSTYSIHAYELTRACILTERGELDRARALAQRLKGMYPADLFPYLVLRDEALEAVVAAAAGEATPWREQLRECLRRIEQMGVAVPAYRQLLLARRLYTLALAEHIETAYVRAWIRTANIRPPSEEVPDWPYAVRIRTLGVFAVELDDAALTFAGKAPRKPLELLQAIIAFGPRPVSAEALCNALWPDSEADAADAALRVTLSRLRKLLKHETAVVVRDGKLALDDRVCWVDAWALDRVADGVAADGARRLLDLYRGAFLEREREQPWMLPARLRLRQRFAAAVGVLGDALERERRVEEAVALYGQALEQDETAEALHRRRMAAHLALGQYADALSAYARCREALSAELGAKPSAETEALRRRIRSG